MKKRFRIPSVLCAVLSCAGTLAAQDPQLPTNPALEAAILVEEVEHDPERALALYRGLAADESVDAGVRRHAWLRVAELTQRLKPEDREAIEAALTNAIAGADDALAARAKALRDAPRPDLERERALRERARELIENWLDVLPSRSSFVENLAWIGEPAVREIAARMRDPDFYTRPKVLANFGQLYPALLRVLWLIDSPISRDLLRATLGDEMVMGEKNDAVFAAEAGFSGADDQVPEANRPLRGAFLRAEEAVAKSALWRFGDAAEWSDLVGALSHPSPDVRKIAKERVVPRLRGAEPSAAAMVLEPVLELLASADPELQRGGQELLGIAAVRSAQARRELIARLDEMRVIGFTGDWLAAPESREELLVALQERVANLDPADQEVADQIVRRLAFGFLEEIRAAEDVTPAEALALLRLGRDGVLEWRHFVRVLTGEHVDDVVRELAGTPLLLDALSWLASADLPADAFAPLAALEPDPSLQPSWLVAIARTGGPEATRFLAERLDSSPLNAGGVVEVALHRSARRDDESTRKLLRDLIAERGARSGADRLGLQRPWDLLFARLVQLGDVEVLRGMRSIEGVESGHGGSVGLPQSIRPDWLQIHPSGLGWLVLSSDGSQYWHGYELEAWLDAWRVLLAPHQGRYWDDAYLVTQAVVERESLRTPDLVRAVLDAWARRVAEDASIDSRGGEVLGHILDAVKPEPGERELAAARERLVAASLEAAAPTVRLAALTQVDPASDRGLEAALGAIEHGDWQVRLAGWNLLMARKQPLDRASSERIVEVVASFEAFQFPLVLLGDRVDAESAMPFAALLDHPEPMTRLVAIQVLAAPMDVAVVPPLLRATAHPDPDTRTAARDALDAIRYHVEQTAHWERVFSGAAQLGRSRAAAKLLDQAAPEQPSARRVLAIRSLGALGEPEVLPFLVDWSESDDAAVAAAAKAALEQIVTSSGR